MSDPYLIGDCLKLTRISPVKVRTKSGKIKKKKDEKNNKGKYDRLICNDS